MRFPITGIHMNNIARPKFKWVFFLQILKALTYGEFGLYRKSFLIIDSFMKLSFFFFEGTEECTNTFTCGLL